MIALEISGMVEVRVDSAIYVLNTSSPDMKLRNNTIDIGPGPLELLEARKEIEDANTALAAQRIGTDCLE